MLCIWGQCMALWKCFAVGSLLLWYKSYNLKYIFCILNHKKSEKKKKKDVAIKFFFCLHGKCGSPVNTVNAVSKKKPG